MRNATFHRLLAGAALWLASATGLVAAETAPPACPAGLIGSWSGELELGELLSVEILVERSSAELHRARIEGTGRRGEEIPLWPDSGRLRFQAVEFPLAGSLMPSTEGERLQGFVHHAATLAAVPFDRVPGRERPTWKALWNPLGVDDPQPSIDLFIAQEPEAPAAYLFFRDPRLPSPWTYGLECDQGVMRFREKNLQLLFEGPYAAGAMQLDLEVQGLGGRGTIVFRRRPEEPEAAQAAAAAGRAPFRGDAPERLDDGWPTAAPAAAGFALDPLRQLVEAIDSGEMTLTHSVLVARGGRLVVEEYFHGFDRATWHDLRSASKTVASTLIGLAIDSGHLDGVQTRALSLLPKYRRLANWDPRKAAITLHHLLAMRSGLDADDWSREGSAAAENTYQSQTAERDWNRIALDAPMIADPGTRTIYGGANPMLLGAVLDEALDEPLEWFAHRALFGPLGVSSYKWFLTPEDRLYLGGGMYLRPRDMAKFGQLYLDGGSWNGRRILSESWVEKSMGRYGRFERPTQRNEYGYLWWHHTYDVGGVAVESVEARGAGGQYIFVVPDLDLVAVITSGNYRNGRFRQPEEILQRFILPAVLAGVSADTAAAMDR